MITAPRTLAALSFAVTCSACNLPFRDNARDPANAPIARLQIVDRGPDCATAPAEAAVASRGSCLTLDASASTNPRGGTRYEFRWSWDTEDDEGSGMVTGSGAVASLSGTLLRQFPVSRIDSDPPLLVPITFEVTVSNSVSSDRTSVDLLLTNARPNARVAEDKSLPHGGFAWDPEADFTVSYASADGSGDPDGDDVELCWTFDAPPSDPMLETVCAAGQEHCGLANDPCVVRRIDSREVAAFPGILRVRETAPAEAGAGETLTSLPAIQLVRVLPAPVWVTRSEGPLERLDTAREVPQEQSDLRGAFGGAAQFPARDATEYPINIILVGAYEDYDTQYYALHYGRGPADGASQVEIDPDQNCDEYHVYGAFSRPSRAYWTVGMDCNLDQTPLLFDGTTRIRRFEVSDFGYSSQALQVTPPSFRYDCAGTSSNPDQQSTLCALGEFRPILDSDAVSNLWLRRFQDESEVEILAPDGSVIASDVGVGSVTGLGARPGTDEVWIVRSGEAGAAASLERRTAGTDGTAFELDTTRARGPFWVDDSLFWLILDDSEARLIDANLLLESVPFEESALASAVVPGDFDGAVPDPYGGTLWGHGRASKLGYAVNPDGTFEMGSLPTRPLLVDQAGLVWFESAKDLGTEFEYKILRGEVPWEHATASFVALDASGGRDLDSLDGGAWIVHGSPAELLHVGPQGVHLERVPTLRLLPQDVVSPPTRVVSLRVDPADPQHGWLVRGEQSYGGSEYGDGVYRYDLTTDPPTATLVLGTSAVSAPNMSPLALVNPIVAMPSPPGIDPAYLWLLRWTGPGNPFRLAKVDETGNAADIFTLPIGEANGQSFVRAARSLRTGAVCLVSLDYSTTPFTLRFRRISSTGVVESLLSVTPAPGDLVLPSAVAASHWNAEDVCWVGWTEYVGSTVTGQVRAFAGPGMERSNFSLSDVQVTSLLPLPTLDSVTSIEATGTQIWATLLGPDGHETGVFYVTYLGVLFPERSRTFPARMEYPGILSSESQGSFPP